LRIEHVYTFKGVPRNIVWETIQDKEVLQKALPGCKVFEEVEENKYHSVLGINIGPIKGEFTADVEQLDMEEPEAYRLLVKAKGKPGEIDADAAIQFEETAEGTVLTCVAEVQITGLLASIGQRVVGGVAKVVIGQFFKDVDKETKKAA
jgi:uncharacterized protein